MFARPPLLTYLTPSFRLSVTSAPGGFLEGQCLRMADYVTGTGVHAWARPPPERANVAYAPCAREAEMLQGSCLRQQMLPIGRSFSMRRMISVFVHRHRYSGARLAQHRAHKGPVDGRSVPGTARPPGQRYLEACCEEN